MDFQKDEIVLKFSKELFHLFKQFENYNLEDIKKMLKLIKLDNMIKKFSINKVENFNREFLYKHYKEFSIDNLLGEKIFEDFQKGLSFNKDYMVYKIDTFIDNKQSEFIVLGNIYNDYISLFNSIKEVG